MSDERIYVPSSIEHQKLIVIVIGIIAVVMIAGIAFLAFSEAEKTTEQNWITEEEILVYHKEVWVNGELNYEKKVWSSGLVEEHTSTVTSSFEVSSKVGCYPDTNCLDSKNWNVPKREGSDLN